MSAAATDKAATPYCMITGGVERSLGIRSNGKCPGKIWFDKIANRDQSGQLIHYRRFVCRTKVLYRSRGITSISIV